MSAKEVWTPTHNPAYEVSNLGRVKRVKGGIGTRVGTILSPSTRSGYHKVTLREPEEQIYVHKLVAEAFIGKRPKGYDINHIDGNKLNNRADNL